MFSCMNTHNKGYLIILLQILLYQVVQLLETPFVNLVNYPSLVATNAARHRFVAGKSKMLLEFGLRRAQVDDLFFFILSACMCFIFIHKLSLFYI